jgi:uncharacterized membrane protein
MLFWNEQTKFFMKRKFPLNFLSQSDIDKVKNKISEIEKLTSGEIVVSIKEKRNFLDKKKSLFDLAKKEFKKAKIADTKDSTGVLIFILFSEKQFYILPDDNIIKFVDKNFWQNLADEMSGKFKANNFVDGLTDCIEKIGEVLKINFPIKLNDKNELPDDIRFS